MHESLRQCSRCGTILSYLPQAAPVGRSNIQDRTVNGTRQRVKRNQRSPTSEKAMRRALQEAERRWVIPSNRAELQSRSHDRAGGGRRGLQTRARQPAAPTARVVHRKNEVGWGVSAAATPILQTHPGGNGRQSPRPSTHQACSPARPMQCACS